MKYLIVLLLIFALVGMSQSAVSAATMEEYPIPDQVAALIPITAILAITTHVPTDTGTSTGGSSIP